MAFRNPRLSICVVATNHGYLLRNLFRNVSRVAWEIVLVDGGSDDDTEEIVEDFPQVRRIYEPWRGSVTHQKNVALKNAEGDWALILDCDEMLSPQLIEALPRLMKAPFVKYYKIPRYNVLRIDPYEYVVTEKAYPDFQFRMLRTKTGLRYCEKNPMHQRFLDPRRPGKIFKGIRKKLFIRKTHEFHIFHYDFLLNDRTAREKKVAFYERSHPGAGLERIYLWEDVEHSIQPISPPYPAEWETPSKRFEYDVE